jgi:hypothetical protein
LNRLAQPRINNWDGPTKLAVALTMLNGDAGMWARSIDETMPWDLFEDAFLERFCEPMEEAMARLARCQRDQSESIQSYTDRFRRDASLAGRSEDRALLYQFLEGMHKHLKLEVLRQGVPRMQNIAAICTFLKS